MTDRRVCIEHRWPMHALREQLDSCICQPHRYPRIEPYKLGCKPSRRTDCQHDAIPLVHIDHPFGDCTQRVRSGRIVGHPEIWPKTGRAAACSALNVPCCRSFRCNAQNVPIISPVFLRFDLADGCPAIPAWFHEGQFEWQMIASTVRFWSAGFDSEQRSRCRWPPWN